MDQQNNVPVFHLVVVHPFGGYARGSVIEEAEAVAEVLAGENAHQVNRVVVR